MAPRVDALYFFLVGLTAFFSLLIAGLIVYYAVKFRRRAPDSVGARIEGGLVLEITWTVIPLVDRAGASSSGAPACSSRCRGRRPTR